MLEVERGQKVARRGLGERDERVCLRDPARRDRRVACAFGTRKVVGPDRHPDRPGTVPVQRIRHVGERRPLGRLREREVDAGASDAQPVDLSLPVRDVDARRRRLRGRAGHKRPCERKREQQADPAPASNSEPRYDVSHPPATLAAASLEAVSEDYPVTVNDPTMPCPAWFPTSH